MKSRYSDREARHFFEVYGPFELPVRQNEILRPDQAWWDDVANMYQGPSPATGIGCYMFTLGRTAIKPWYIGQTRCQAGFRGEVFTDHKLDHYNSAFAGRRGPPQMFFFPLITSNFHDPNWKLSKDRSSTKRLIDWLERTLIGMALARNPDLQNTKDATFLRTVRLRSIIGAGPLGRPHGEVQIARAALLGLDD